MWRKSRAGVAARRREVTKDAVIPEHERMDGGPRLPRLPALDGLRAFAVIAVLLYHGGIPWLPGGFLGVEVFFVISGYLITALLLAEWRHVGRIDLKAFWLRRARRLLPALYLVLAATLAFAVLLLPEEVAGLRADVLAALGYATNWYLVIGHESYFEAVGRPSLLKHLWSLAIEEQFYVVWPVVFAAVMGLGARRWRRRRTLMLALAGAAASALLTAAMYSPHADPSRLYYGTDTRASGLLIGAALAFLWEPARFYNRRAHQHAARGRTSWLFPLLLDAAGLGALGGLVLLYLRMGEFQPFLYQGGFVVVGLATAAVLAAIVHPRTVLGTGLLSWVPLRWVGVRSYGIYLWHWPVFMVTRPGLDVSIDGPALLALRLTITVVLADISYRYVETPIRRGALERAWRELRDSRGSRRRKLGAIWLGTAVPIVALCAALGVAAARIEAPKTPEYIASMKAIHTKVSSAKDTLPNKEETTPAADHRRAQLRAREMVTERANSQQPSARPKGSASASRDDGQHEATVPHASVGPVTAIGDSVMLGSAGVLRQRVDNITVMDAEVGLQTYDAVAILRSRRAQGLLGNVVIVDIGSNGVITQQQFDQMMRILSGVPRVVLVNVTVPRPWEEPNNEILAKGAQKYPNVVLADWHSVSARRPELFAMDGIHPQPPGQRLYADVIAEQVYAP